MKIILAALAILILEACATKTVLMQNCRELGGEVWRCERLEN